MPESNILRISSMLDSGAPSIVVRPSYHTAVGSHSHDYFEMVYIRDGFCLHEAGERMMLLTEGDMFVIRPGQMHRYIGNRAVNLFNCMFTLDELRGCVRAPETLPAIARLIDDHDASGQTLIHLDLNERKTIVKSLSGMLDELAQKQIGWETRLTGVFACLLVDYARIYAAHLGANGEKQAYTGYVTPALAYIDSHYAQDLTVRDIAAAVGVSGDYLTRQFRLATATTPLEYLRRYRFARAMELLQSDISITEAAERVGFKNLCHFSREFKKELGITPSQYRNQNE